MSAMSERYDGEEPNQGDAEVAVDVGDLDGSDSIAVVFDNAIRAETWETETRHQDDEEGTIPPNKLQQMVDRCKIHLAVHNPLPSICRSVRESHFDHASLETKEPRRFWPSPLRDDLVHDLEAAVKDGGSKLHQNAAAARGRDDLVIKNLSMAIQLAFRQNALRVLVVAKCGTALCVCVCIALFPFESWRQQRASSDSWLPHVMLVASGVMYILTLSLLHGVRFEYPTNGVVLAFLLCIEVYCLLLWCLFGNLHAVVLASTLFCGLMVVLYVLSTFKWRVQTTGNFALLHPVVAALLSIALTTVLTASIYYVLEGSSTISLGSFTGVMAFIACTGMWTGFTLHGMIESLIPEEHASCLIFYHCDLVVVFFLVPLRGLQQLLVWCARMRRASTKHKSKQKTVASSILADRASMSDHSGRQGYPVVEEGGFNNIAMGSSERSHTGMCDVTNVTAPASSDSVGSPVVANATARRRSSIVETV